MFTIVTQIRNEEKRLIDWLEYHKNIGVDEFLIYLDNSDDNSEKILNDNKEKYNIIIDYAKQIGNYIDGENPNNYGKSSAYLRINESATRSIIYLKEKYKNVEHWTLFVEVDEFINLQKVKNLQELIEKTNKNTKRIYMSSYDYKCPFDLDSDISVYHQTYMRWSEKTRQEGVVNGKKGYFKNRGKSMIKTNLTKPHVVNIHVIDDGDYEILDKYVRLNHYRNYGELQIYDFFDDSIKNNLK